ncbi:MAG TPA: rod shape-determining protein MreC [Streptosporangiaceae bacterium]
MRDTRRTRLLLSIALIAALALIAVDYQHGSSPVMRTVKHTAGSVFGAAESAVSFVTGPITRFVGGGLAGSSGGQVAVLKRELAKMRAELSAAKLSKSDYARLHRLLALAGTGSYRVVAASVIAFGQGYQQTVTLDAGSSDGVRPQETVLDGDGLVGQVTAVTADTCTVLLATDPSSVVGVRMAPQGQVGWVTGEGSSRTGPGELKLAVLDPGAVLKPGEQLVTAASVHDRPFVPGVPVGTVISVKNKAGALTAQALVRPFVSFASLNIVGIVIAPPRHNPRFSVLPPKPPKPAPPPPVKPAKSRRTAGQTGTTAAGH